MSEAQSQKGQESERLVDYDSDASMGVDQEQSRDSGDESQAEVNEDLQELDELEEFDENEEENEMNGSEFKTMIQKGVASGSMASDYADPKWALESIKKHYENKLRKLIIQYNQALPEAPMDILKARQADIIKTQKTLHQS